VVPGTSIPDPLGGVAVDSTPIAVVHPTFLYELIWNLLVAALVVWADRKFRLGHGRAFAVYVAGYTLGRFFIEQMRSDPATRVFGDIRINVVVAGVVFLAAVAYLVLVRKPREVLVDLPGGPAADSTPAQPAPAVVAARATAATGPEKADASATNGADVAEVEAAPAVSGPTGAASAASDPAPVPSGAPDEGSTGEPAGGTSLAKPDSGKA
jgi:hypothetical protein